MITDWSLVIALAALLVSVLSPVLTSLVNNHHTWKMRQSEFKLNHRIAALENYIRAAGRVCGYGTADNFAAYWACVGEVYMYIPQSLWPLVDGISDALRKVDYTDAQKKLSEFSKAIAKAGLVPSL